MLEIDVLFLYKIQVFNGFAPCFDNDLFSLVCCKGCQNKKGMRTVIGDLHAKNLKVWILAIAGEQICNYNFSNIHYRSGDLVYLARITDCCSLKEYGERYTKNEKSLRKDAIYYFDEQTQQIEQIKNGYHDQKQKPTDVGSNQVDCHLVKQALLSTDYYVFNAGNRLEYYTVSRGFKYKGVSGESIAQFVETTPDSYTYHKNPFDIQPEGTFMKGCQQ